uniref:Uncharacterized protein n=1 Tax=Magallana gigas TaxID=29159 RepID=A0A8W8MGW1_MAGGI
MGDRLTPQEAEQRREKGRHNYIFYFTWNGKHVSQTLKGLGSRGDNTLCLLTEARNSNSLNVLIIQNLIQELPHHVGENNKQDFLSFSDTTIGNKNQIKGSDARLYVVKLAKFSIQKYEEGKITESIPNLVNSLVDIVTICYSDYDTRSPKQLLRLYNQCFVFGLLCKSVIGNPHKLTTRKFYGNHFHSITIHVPETARLFCIKSIVPEQEERSFGTLRRISENTTNRQPKFVVDNAMLRMKFQTSLNNPTETMAKQNSTVSKQAKLLPAKKRTVLQSTLLKKFPLLIQSHLERIADFVLPGKNVWWSVDAEDGMIFHDGPEDDERRPDGPQLHHFRSRSLKEERMWIKQKWQECLHHFASGELQLPFRRLKTYEDGKIIYISKGTKGIDDDYFAHQKLTQTKDDAKKRYTDLRSKNEESGVRLEPSHDMDKENEPLEEGIRGKQAANYSPSDNHVEISNQITDKACVASGRKRALKEENTLGDAHVKKCRRQLFQTSQRENDEQSNCTKNEAKRYMTDDLVQMLLGKCTEVEEFLKYRRDMGIVH